MAKVHQVLTNLLKSSGNSDLTIVTYENSKPKTHPTCARDFSLFIEKYCEAVEEEEKLCFGEAITKTNLPIIGNFIFRFDTYQDVYYNDDFIPELVKCYQNTIEECFENTYRDDIYRCIILESEDANNIGDNYYINVRIQFPFCHVNKDDYKKFFRPILIQSLKKMGMGFFHTAPLDEWSNSLQEFEKSIPLYGSRNDNHDSPKFLCAYGQNATSIKLYFDPDEHSFVVNGQCNFDFCEKFSYESMLPILLSIYFSGFVLSVDPSHISNVPESKNVSTLDWDDGDILSDNPKSMFTYLIEMISIERSSKKNYWLDVGRAIHNIFGYSEEGVIEGLEEWKKFTARGTINVEDCEIVYPQLIDSHLTIKTIAFYAREDNPELYKEWHNRWTEPSLNCALDLTHKSVSEAFYRFMWLEFIFSPNTEFQWFHYNGVYLEPYNEISVLHKITKEFITVFQRYKHNLAQLQLDEKIDDKSKKIHMQDEKQVIKLIEKLSNGPYQKQILEFSKQYFRVTNFDKIYDSNANTIACRNCIIEVYSNEVVCRTGKPEDYITKCTEKFYPRNYTWKTKNVQTVMKIFNQMMIGDSEFVDFFWRFNASMLRGRNLDKIFPICTGEGDNGKSIYAKFLQHAFGSYCVDMPPETISGKGGRGGEARADLAQAHGTRIATVIEPSNNHMQSNVIKKFTGNDRSWCRGLFQKGGAIEQFYKLILLCNEIPDFSQIEKAIIIRVLLIPFKACFCNDAPEDEDEQYSQKRFPRDDTLEDKIPELSTAFLWILVQYYPKYIKEGIKNRPSIVIKTNDEHWMEKDPYQCFITENLIRTGNPDDTIKYTEVFKTFKAWYIENYGMDKDTLKQDHVISQLKQSIRLGVASDRRWKGWRFKEDQVE
jgi:phage/plasmid-associated DNA primase